MISYELAKQLKEGGFPQAGDGKWIGPADSLVCRSADRVYVPTLEELIGALGHHFYSLEQIGPQRAFLRLLLHRVGNDNAALRLFLSLDAPVPSSQSMD